MLFQQMTEVQDRRLVRHRATRQRQSDGAHSGGRGRGEPLLGQIKHLRCGFPLGQRVSRQRASVDEMRPERRQRLDEIGFARASARLHPSNTGCVCSVFLAERSIRLERDSNAERNYCRSISSGRRCDTDCS